MSPIIHCTGHKFEEVAAKKSPNVFNRVWICLYCQLRVTRESAMKQLTGKIC